MKIVTNYEEIREEHLFFVRKWMDDAMDVSPDGYFTVFGRKGINKMVAESLEYFKSLDYQLNDEAITGIEDKCERVIVNHEHKILD